MTEAEAGTEEGSSRSLQLKELALERTGLFLAVFGFALLVVKVVRVSHLNPRTAHGLIEEVGPVSVVLGELVGHFPLILFIVSVLSLWWALGSLAAIKTFTPAHASVAGVIFFAVILLPWPYLIALGVVAVARWVHARAVPHRVGMRSRQYYLLAGAFAVLLLADSDVWLPAETFSLEDGTSVVGYALSEQALGGVVVLTEEDRMIIRFLQDEIDDREPCRHSEHDAEFTNFPSLLQVAIHEEARLPEPPCEEH